MNKTPSTKTIVEETKKGLSLIEIAEKYSCPTTKRIWQKANAYKKRNPSWNYITGRKYPAGDDRIVQIYEDLNNGGTYKEASEKYQLPIDIISSRVRSYALKNNLPYPNFKKELCPGTKLSNATLLEEIKRNNLTLHEIAIKYNIEIHSLSSRAKFLCSKYNLPYPNTKKQNMAIKIGNEILSFIGQGLIKDDCVNERLKYSDFANDLISLKSILDVSIKYSLSARSVRNLIDKIYKTVNRTAPTYKI